MSEDTDPFRLLLDDMQRFLRGGDRPEQRDIDLITRLMSWRNRLEAAVKTREQQLTERWHNFIKSL